MLSISYAKRITPQRIDSGCCWNSQVKRDTGLEKRRFSSRAANGPRRVSPWWNAQASHRALWTASAFRSPGSIQRDLRYEETRIGRKKRRGERKRGRALINTSYKNAEVHNLHELETERARIDMPLLLSISLLSSLSALLSPGNAEHNG